MFGPIRGGAAACGWYATFVSLKGGRQRAIYRNLETDLRGGLEFGSFAQGICRQAEDSRDGVRAFIEKRAPVFKGR